MTYTLNEREVDLGGIRGRVEHRQVEGVAIHGGSLNDTFDVESSLASVDLTLNGHAGSDAFLLAEPTGDLVKCPRRNPYQWWLRRTNSDQPTGNPTNDKKHGTRNLSDRAVVSWDGDLHSLREFASENREYVMKSH